MNLKCDIFFISFLKCVVYEGKRLIFVTRLLPVAAPVYRQSRPIMECLCYPFVTF